MSEEIPPETLFLDSEKKDEQQQDTKGLMALYHKYRNFILYLFIGGFSAGLDFTLFAILDYTTGWNYQISNLASTHLGIATSFSLNAYFNFKVEDKMLKRFFIFYLVGLGGWLISAISLWLMIDMMQWNNILAKMISIIFVVAFQFTLNKLVTFAK